MLRVCIISDDNNYIIFPDCVPGRHIRSLGFGSVTAGFAHLFRFVKKINITDNYSAVMKPSDFAKLQSLSLKQRMQIPTFHKTEIVEFLNVSTREAFGVPVTEPIFKPLPTKVILQNYEPLETYEVTITFRNMEKVCRLLIMSGL